MSTSAKRFRDTLRVLAAAAVGPGVFAALAATGFGSTPAAAAPEPLAVAAVNAAFPPAGSPALVSAANPQAIAEGASRDAYVGAEGCRSCHRLEYDEWAGSRHSRMVQPIKPAEVRAAFRPGQRLEYRGRTYTFERDGLDFVIVENRPGQPEVRHAIEYTLGNRRIQHYLVRQPNGALVLLPPSWDVERNEWFPQEDIVPTGDSSVEPVQVWNKNCFGCHVSQERKNFDVATLSYDTDWLDSGTNCETCHGPGRDHVERFEALARGEDPPPIDSWQPMKRPLMPFAGEAAAELCASCHQNRYLLQADYAAGEPFYDHFLTALPYTVPPDAPDPGYWADGRTRRFSNNSFGLWLSSCYLDGGVRCIDCHTSSHAINIDDNPQLTPAAAGTALCNDCHTEIVAAVEQHSRHPADSPGASCLSCHMPRTVSGIKATMRDHALAVPVPENTRDYGVPNACNQCHETESPDWAAQQIETWYGALEERPKALKLRRRAAAFSGAPAGAEPSLAALLEIVRDEREPFLMRATAAGYLREYEQDAALEGLYDALVDPHPLVRAVAPLSIAAHPRGRSLLNSLVAQLSDPSYSVRINTAFALANLGIGRAEGALGRQLRRAQDEYLEHLELYSDSPEDQANRGALLSMRGEFGPAVEAYRTALRLDAEHHNARFGLGVALLRTGSREEAVRELELLRRQAPSYPGLQALLSQLSSLQRR